MIVKIRPVGGDEKYAEVPDGASVADCLRKAGQPTSGVTVSINGSTVSMDAEVRHKQTIVLTSKVAGGNR